ncbi:hypothetical protein [Salinarimonas chemoclinalis]|uniref:hypothetical protein n=1 Tax=Salinarimonas chemoclinalis TaxID=3241599 RepID=UPI003558BD63
MGIKPRSYSISLFSSQFPAHMHLNVMQRHDITWDQLIWSALSIGRPGRQQLALQNKSDYYEALFRCSLLWMAIEQKGFSYYRTDAFKTLDPTEKGSVNYFIGMTVCKLFAALILRTPHTLHIDAFPGMVRLAGRSRPDLFGQDVWNRNWRVFEAKGRGSLPSADDKLKAKQQAQRVVDINGQLPDLNVAGISYFRGDILTYTWSDPSPKGELSLSVPEGAWRLCFSCFMPFLSEVLGVGTAENPRMVDVPAIDVKMGVHPKVGAELRRGDWRGAIDSAHELQAEFKELGFMPDGVRISAGDRWKLPRPMSES